MSQAVYRELVLKDVDAVDSADAIQKVGQVFLQNGFVKDSYIDAVLAREIVYPTGLQLGTIAIAMPHTDVKHVLRPAVGIAKMKNPVTFKHMGEPETEVQVEMLFMMAITDPNQQIDTLKRVLTVFQNAEATEAFRGAKSEEELFAVALEYIG